MQVLSKKLISPKNMQRCRVEVNQADTLRYY